MMDAGSGKHTAGVAISAAGDLIKLDIRREKFQVVVVLKYHLVETALWRLPLTPSAIHFLFPILLTPAQRKSLKKRDRFAILTLCQILPTASFHLGSWSLAEFVWRVDAAGRIY
ncbi:hypothetical protein [Salmonella enterica]|uniref:hypothetical protein n=1 Tax=Salmonella enterica TaxID=28901 RepID=UPI001590655B|nr:hypothetical protein [Salmonella enterica]